MTSEIVISATSVKLLIRSGLNNGFLPESNSLDILSARFPCLESDSLCDDHLDKYHLDRYLPVQRHPHPTPAPVPLPPSSVIKCLLFTEIRSAGGGGRSIGVTRPLLLLTRGRGPERARHDYTGLFPPFHCTAGPRSSSSDGPGGRPHTPPSHSDSVKPSNLRLFALILELLTL